MELLIFIFGLCIGSFLNVCIYRMPLEQSVMKPARSYCPKCKTKIAAYDNIPVLSWVLLGGKCRKCKAKISIVYPGIEILTGLSFIGLFLYYGPTPLFLAYAFMAACFIVATFVDFGHRIIPDEISIGGMFCGLLLSLFILSLHDLSVAQHNAGRIVMWCILGAAFTGNFLLNFLGPKEDEAEEDAEAEEDQSNKILIFMGFCLVFDLGIKFFVSKAGSLAPYLLNLDAAVIGALVGGGLIYFMGVMGDLIFRKESMGGGDVKLLAMIGAFLGWKAAILTFFIAPFFGALFGLVEWARTKDNTLAYGPFLILAALICLFYEHQIIHWLLYRHQAY